MTKRLLTLGVSLAMLVTVCVPGALITKADNQPTCGIVEHTHTEACYQDNELICDLEQHIHDEGCYAVESVDPENPVDPETPDQETPDQETPNPENPDQETPDQETPNPENPENPQPENPENPQPEEKVCTCDPKPAEGEPHQKDCPLYVEPACTCDPKPAEGEPHQKDCPLYVEPACTCDPKPAEGEPHQEGCPLYEKVCTCDPKPEEGQPHKKGCPLYVKPAEDELFEAFYKSLMETKTMDEFEAFAKLHTEEELERFEKWVVEKGLLEQLQNHIYSITPPPTISETVVFTDAGPFMPPVDVTASGSGY